MTFCALNPQRADDKMYDLSNEPLDEGGQVVTNPGAGNVDWS